jgi:site-specific recombinase XerD
MESKNKFEQQLKLEGKTNNTIQQYLYAFNRFKNHSTGRLTQENINSFLSENNNSINRSMLKHYISLSGRTELKVPNTKRKYRRIPKTLSEDDIQRLIDFVEKPYSVMVWLMAETGARIGEAVKIRHEDIDYENERILVEGKGEKERYLRPSPELLKALSELGDGYSGYVWDSDYREGHITDRTIRNKIQEIVPHATPHMLRHSFATKVYDSTQDLLSTKELLGHSDVSTTSIYAHISNRRAQEASKTAWRNK